MRFSVLGPLRVETGGRTVPLGGPRQRAVLAALLTAPDEPVSRARIMDLVWDDPTPSAAVNLRGYVSKLRAALHDPADPEPRIVWDQGLRLRVAPGELDVWEFDLHAAEAQRMRDEGRLAEAAEAYRAALALVRADPFQDIEGSGSFEEVRTPLRERRDLAFERYAATGLDLGRHAELVGELRTWHARQPLWEHLAAQLMLALFRSGRRSEALAVFQETSETLVDELGTGPDRELRLMHRRILADDPGLQPTARGRRAPVPRQLPAASAHFTGRATELAALDGLLTDGGEAVAVLSGPGGIGKTALALHWAHRVAAKFPDGQIHLDLRGFDPAAGPMDPGEALRAVLDAHGVPAEHLPDGADAQSALLRSVLADKRVLMVLDNARDAAQVRPLLPGTAESLVLVTSRNRLSALTAGGAKPLHLTVLDTADAERFIRQRLRDRRPTAEPEALGQIIASCAGLPLALAVAAARAVNDPAFPLAALAEELRPAERRLDALADPDGSTDLRTVFACSYRDLSPAAARLFRLLSVHPGPTFALAGAAAVAAAPARETRLLLTELTRANLLNESGPGRFGFHDLTRAYAAELAATERRDAVRRLLDECLHTAHAANLLLDPHRDPLDLVPALDGTVTAVFADAAEAMDWFHTESAVLTAAVGLAAEHGYDRHCWQLAWTLRDYLDRGRRHEQAAVFGIAIEAARRLGDGPAQVKTGRLLAEALSCLGRHSEAAAILDRTQALCRERGDLLEQGHTWYVHARLLHRQARFAEAVDSDLRALDLYHRVGHEVGKANALNAIGWNHSLAGDHAQAIGYCEEALALMRTTGDRHGQAATLDSLGHAFRGLGRHAEAVAYFHASLDLYRDLGNRHEEASTVLKLADAHHEHGDRAEARRTWERGLAILDELNHPDARAVRARIAALDG
ncbi:BTAD domain-containing putative transcriptional regulator [Glycomyces sp. NPDC047010]|uniref:AfsR/SARP family transcriptional regulator n=1 Tax=Glycomyces sp. NPDC047010 TaxID=3155023 RepID=UPI0034081DD3